MISLTTYKKLFLWPAIVSPQSVVEARGNVTHWLGALKSLWYVLSVALKQVDSAADDDDDNGEKLRCCKDVLRWSGQTDTVTVHIGDGDYEEDGDELDGEGVCLALGVEGLNNVLGKGHANDGEHRWLENKDGDPGEEKG